MSGSDHVVIPAEPVADRPPYSFVARTRVAFSDTDAQGIVYYGRYAPYFDLARIEYLRHLDLSLMTAAHAGGGDFVMRHFEIDFHAPAAFDDELEVYVHVAKIGTSSMTFEYEVVGAGNLRLATARQVLVLVDLAERRPKPIPNELRAPIEAFEAAHP